MSQNKPSPKVKKISSPGYSRSTSLFRFHAPEFKPHEKKLALFYSAIMTLIVFLAWKSPDESPKIEYFIATLWVGFLLAISFMEAWVKFKAPLLLRHIAVDVGRHIFEALNVVEFILMFTLWCLRCNRTVVFSTILAVCTAILCFEILIVTPILTNLAKFRIIQAMGEDEKHHTVISQLKQEVFGLTPAKPYWHFIYILLECIKVICLLIFISQVLTDF
jgi:hypothetical protein